MQIGIDVGGTKVEVVALDEAGTELTRRRRATPAGDYPAIVGLVADMVADVEAEFGAASTVGVGTPGAIDPVTGLMKNSNSTALNGRPLDADLAAALGRQIVMANDADCLAVSEAADGSAAGAGVVFAAILGTGVGGGLVVGGRLVSGPNAIAGEWGHNPLPWMRPEEAPGRICYCGRRGCIETFLSGPGLAADYARRGGSAIDAAAVVASAASGDARAATAVAAYCDRLARALAGIINIVDPDVIVLGGGVSNTAAIYAAVPAIWGEYVFGGTVLTQLVAARHGDSSGVRGAARLWSAL